MRIQYNIPKLKQILRDLSTLTRISIGFLDTEYQPLFQQGKPCDFCSEIQKDSVTHALCGKSDREILAKCQQSRRFESHLCHAGLYDAVIPVVKNDVVAGYVIMGRIRSSDSPPTPPSGYDAAKELYRDIPLFTDAQINSLRSLLQDIVFESAIELDDDTAMDDIVRYIQTHLHEQLTVESLCTQFFVSRNYLYRGFRQLYGCTVNEYIARARLKQTKQLLEETKQPVRLICEQVGIGNYTYFCKWFKKQTGTSPMQYRNTHQSAEEVNDRV